MATIRLKYIKRFEDRHGTVRHYYNRSGFPKTVLPGKPGSPEFMAAYQLASGEKPQIVPGKGRHKTGSFSALLAEYYGSAEFKGVKDLTRKNYRYMLEKFSETRIPDTDLICGDVQVKDFRPAHIRRILDSWADKPGLSRNIRLRILKVFSFAVQREYCDANPVREIKAVRPKRKGGFPTWTQEEIALYFKHHAENPKARLAMQLLLSLAVRRSDAHRLGRQHIIENEEGRFLSFRSVKGDKQMTIAIDDDLQRELDLVPADQIQFLVTEYGKPFSAVGFSNKFKAWAVEAGVKGKSAHGIRKAAAVEAAHAGSSAHEVAALHGHNNLREVEIYTAEVEQMRLAKEAQTKREKAKARTKTFKPD
ncbi:tyrosine-type recombinase/integrase [Asticcacaulis sp.]|uniref:site-specific integrase n=1 Tax=Asticcacaulis sp. TaxID=1872648 RepID=UPI0031D55EBE